MTMAKTNAVTLSVALLLSLLFLLSNAVDVDPTSVTTPQIMDVMTAVDSEPNAVIVKEEEPKPEDRVEVFRPAVESISAVNPDLIAHSFRIPFHRRAGRPRCRHGHADGLIRLPSGRARRHVHRGEGFGLNPDSKKNELEEKEEKEFDEEELEHKRMKMMRKMRRENKDDGNDEDDDEKTEKFEHKRKKMMRRMRFNESSSTSTSTRRTTTMRKMGGRSLGTRGWRG